MKFNEWIEWYYKCDKHSHVYNIICHDKKRCLKNFQTLGWVPSDVISLSDSTIIELDGGDVLGPESPSKIIKWCNENCNSKWHKINPAWWAFECEEDALAFKLRW